MPAGFQTHAAARLWARCRLKGIHLRLDLCIFCDAKTQTTRDTHMTVVPLSPGPLPPSFRHLLLKRSPLLCIGAARFISTRGVWKQTAAGRSPQHAINTPICTRCWSLPPLRPVPTPHTCPGITPVEPYTLAPESLLHKAKKMSKRCIKQARSESGGGQNGTGKASHGKVALLIVIGSPRVRREL